MPLTPTQLAYLAGIIDGEGCIRVNGKGGRWPVIRVHVTNTDQRLTDWLKATCGGYVWKETKAYAPNAKIRFVWELNALKATAFLEQILPYLLLKRERAEIVLRLQATKIHRGLSVPPSVLIERRELSLRLTALNKKGTV